VAVLLVAAATAVPAISAGAAAPADAPRPDRAALAGLLAAAANAEARSAIVQQLGETAACPELAGFDASSESAVREQAVRSMDQAGCAAIEYYRPYMRDPNPWVTDALVAAIERYRIGEAIPFLISHLPDPRRILSSGGVWTIGERSHRALRVVSCQSLHYDPDGPEQARARAAARWTTWHAEHGGESRAAWLEAGIARAGEYLQSDDGRLRLEGLELLLLIGAPAAAEMEAAFRRDPSDFEASMTCSPEEPPRVTEEVPCLFQLSNRSERRIAFVPGVLSVALRRQGAREDEMNSARAGQLSSSPEAADPDASMAAWVDQIIDLAPGQRLGWPILIGPVSTAGRYDVQGTLADLSARIVKPDKRAKRGAPAVIKAGTVVRFNQ